MPAEPPGTEPGTEVWVAYSARWRRGVVRATEENRARVQFSPGAGRPELLRWFDLDADPAVLLPGSYSSPVKWRCPCCVVTVRGAPGQAAEQVWAGHAATPEHRANKSTLAPLQPRRRLADLVPPERLVWATKARPNIVVHPYRPGQEQTDCRLVVATGTTLVAQDAVNLYRARPCRACRWES